MSYSKEYITETARDVIRNDTLPPRKKYNWIDIVAIPQRPETVQDSLYCASYSDGQNGWDNGFDRRPLANKIAMDKGWDLLIDKTLDVETPYLKVDGIYQFTEKIYQRVRRENSPFVIGVTGSVGKTTTIAFLEHLINSAGINTERFYSKRLTPLSVQCHFINRVDKNTSVIVMEYSAYMTDHVKELASILSPNLAFLTNIYDTHINPGMFKSKNEIFLSKLNIKTINTAKGFLNATVPKELNISSPKDWITFEVEEPQDINPNLPPTLRTSELFTVGKIVSNELSIDESTFLKAYRSFQPKEKRIILFQTNDKNIYFHGETSGGSRLFSWFETKTVIPWFFVEELNFADENPEGFKQLLEKVFLSDKTFVLDTKSNREKLTCSARFLSKGQFLDKFRNADGYIVYHKALSTRENNFSPEKYLREILY